MFERRKHHIFENVFVYINNVVFKLRSLLLIHTTLNNNLCVIVINQPEVTYYEYDFDHIPKCIDARPVANKRFMNLCLAIYIFPC